MTTAHIVILSAVILLLIAWGVRAACRYMMRAQRRLRLLLDALESADTSLRFPVGSDRTVNSSLNRIAGCLSALRSQAVETDRYYGLITDAVATGVLVIARSGHILLANPAALRQLGRPALTRLSSLSESWPELVDVLEGLPTGLDTTVRHLAVKTSAFVRHDGERLLIVMLDDISAQLEASSVETWTEMSRVLTHEIMNGIAPVVSIADTLRLRYGDADDYMTRGLDAISESTRGLKEFVGNYKRLSSLPMPEKSVFTLRPLLESVVTLARAGLTDQSDMSAVRDTDGLSALMTGSNTNEAADSHLRFNLAHPLEELTVSADRDQLRQVLLNLVKNAIEAGAQLITLRASATDSRVVIEIENDGSPLAADISRRIFTPFFTTKPGGTGIGLSLSRHIVMANGGTLSLTSSPASATTRFTITLPGKTNG